MRATAEPVEGNRIRLSIEVDETEVDDALSATIRRLGRQVRIPGFRPGKVPRQVLEARMGGVAALRQQAINDLLPDLYAQAVSDTAVDPIAAPEIDVKGGDEPGPLTVDAVVEVRPVVSVAGYQGLQITVPDVSVTDEEVDRQIDRLRETEGELVVVDRPIETGDFVTIDLHASRPGARSTDEDLDVEDFVYEVGSGTALPGLDDNLRAARAGDVISFTVPTGEADSTDQDSADQDSADQDSADQDSTGDEDGDGTEGVDGGEQSDGGEHAEAEPSLVAAVTVKEVQQKVLPEASDEWAAGASEFASLAELRQDLRDRLQKMKAVQLPMVVRERTTEALVALVSDDPPAVLVDAEISERLHDLSHRLEQRNMDLGEFLARSGRDEQGLVEELREEANRAVLLDLALRALAEAEAIEVSDDELEQVLADMALQVGTSPKDLRNRLERAGRLPSVRSERRKAKALQWLEAHIDLVDESGNPVARSDLNAMTGGAIPDVDSPGSDEEDPEHRPQEPTSRTDGTDERSPGSQPQEGHDVEVDS